MVATVGRLGVRRGSSIGRGGVRRDGTIRGGAGYHVAGRVLSGRVYRAVPHPCEPVTEGQLRENHREQDDGASGNLPGSGLVAENQDTAEKPEHGLKRHNQRGDRRRAGELLPDDLRGVADAAGADAEIEQVRNHAGKICPREGDLADGAVNQGTGNGEDAGDGKLDAADLKAQLNRIEAQLELQDEQNRSIMKNQRLRMLLTIIITVVLLVVLGLFWNHMDQAYKEVMTACTQVNELADTLQSSLDTLDPDELNNMMQDLPAITEQLKQLDVDSLNTVLQGLPTLMDNVNKLQQQVETITNTFSGISALFGK